MRSLVAALLAALVLAACSSPQKRVNQHRSLFETYPKEVQQKILAGQVEVGFTAEQVQMAWGSPTNVYSAKTQEGAQEIWSYGGGASGPAVGFGVSSFGGPVGYGVGVGSGPGYPDETGRLVFQDGRVTSVQQKHQ